MTNIHTHMTEFATAAHLHGDVRDAVVLGAATPGTAVPGAAASGVVKTIAGAGTALAMIAGTRGGANGIEPPFAEGRCLR